MVRYKIQDIPWDELHICGGEKASNFPALLENLFSGDYRESNRALSRIMSAGLNSEVTPYVIDILITKLSEENDRSESWDLYSFINETRWSGGEEKSIYSGRETTEGEAVAIALATGIGLFTLDLLNSCTEIRYIAACVLLFLHEDNLVGLEQQNLILENLLEKEDDFEVSKVKQTLLLIFEGQDPKKIVFYRHRKWFKTIGVYQVEGESRLSELIVAQGWFETEEALNRFYDKHEGIPIKEF